MDFKEFFLLFEAGQVEWGFTGGMQRILGSGEAETLHYGTAKNFSKPMLYVPLDLSIANSFRRRAEKIKFDCVMTRHGSMDCTNNPVKEKVNKFRLGAKEAHLTISMGNELETALKRTGMEPVEALKHISLEAPFSPEKKEGLTYLFDDNNAGIRCPFSAASDEGQIFKLVPTFVYTDKLVAVIVFVKCPNLVPIRNSLGLPELPQLPPEFGVYRPHVTIGYLASEDVEVSGWTVPITRTLAPELTQSYLQQKPTG